MHHSFEENGSNSENATNHVTQPETALGGVLAMLFVIVGFFFLVGQEESRQGWKNRNHWERFANQNPELEIIAVQQGQYGPDKWNSSQLIVEVRATTTGETRMIREKDGHVPFNHLPQKGEIWRCWIQEGREGSMPYCFTFRMEPISRRK